MSVKKPKEDYVSAVRVIHPNGFIEFRDELGNTLFRKHINEKDYNKILDARENPPYLTLSPCPRCGSFKDRGHNPMMHINPLFGKKAC